MSKQHILLFIHIESILAVKTSRAEAFTRSTVYPKLPLIVQQAFDQRDHDRQDWRIIFYSDCGEDQRAPVLKWLTDQRMWSDTQAMLLMKDSLFTQEHSTWTVGMIHQVSALLGANNPANDWCHVFDSEGKKLQKAFDQASRGYADVIVYSNTSDLLDDLARAMLASPVL